MSDRGSQRTTSSTGTAGVYAALSQLWRLPGVSATNFPDHTPGIDLIALHDGQICTIQVKSTSSDLRRWRLYDDGRFPDVAVFILVAVHSAGEADAFFVVPTAALADATEASYHRWRARHDDRETESRFLGFDEPEGAAFLEPYRDRWDLLFSSDGGS